MHVVCSFVIYINDLPDGLDSIFKMYADDSKVIAESGSKLQDDILKSFAFISKNKHSDLLNYL